MHGECDCELATAKRSSVYSHHLRVDKINAIAGPRNSVVISPTGVYGKINERSEAGSTAWDIFEPHCERKLFTDEDLARHIWGS